MKLTALTYLNPKRGFYLLNLIISLLLFLFLFPKSSFASTFYDTAPPSGTGYVIVSAQFCNADAECANSQNPGNCGLATCSGGKAWTKYELTCIYDEERLRYDGYYQQGEAVCAIGDKCVGGEEGLRSGSCTCGNYSPSIYKYCCSTSGADQACTTAGVPQDNFSPPEGQCPGGSVVGDSNSSGYVSGSPCQPNAPPPPPTTELFCGDGVCNNGETQQSCPQDCGSPPPPPPIFTCGELINGSLSQPTSGSNVSSPITFSGQYWAQPGKCVSFEVHPTDSYIAVDEGSSTQLHFNFAASDMNNGFFNKSVNLSPGNHNVFVHIEGWCPPEGRNGYVRLPIQGASCGSETITVTQANQPPTCNISTDPTPQAPQGTIVAISVTGTDTTKVQTIQTTFPGGGHTFTNTGSPTSYTIEDSWNTTGVAPADYSVSAIVTDNNGSATSCSKTFKVTQPGQWVPPFCNGQTFVGCTQQGGDRCSDWGNPADSDWAVCQNACNRTNPNTYCDISKVSGSAQCSGTDSQISWSWQGGSTGKYKRVILHNDTLGDTPVPFDVQPTQTSLVTGQLPEENKLWLEVYDSNNTFIGSSTIVTSLKCSSTTPGVGGSVPGCTKCATSAAAAGTGCNYAFNSSLDNACSQANGVSSGYYCYLCSQSNAPPPESPGYITVKVSAIEDQADKPSPYPVCNYPMGNVDGSSGTTNNNQSCLYTDLSPRSSKGVAGANIQIVCQYANRSSGGSTGITGSDGAVYLQVYRPYEGSKPAEQPKMTCSISVVAPQDYSSSYATCRKQYTYRGYDGFTGAYDQSPSQQITMIAGDSCLDFFESENHSAPNGPDAGFTAKTFTDPPAAIFVLRKIPGAWIQTTGGDVHSNTRIDTPGGPP